MKKPLAIFFADSHLDLGAWANRPRLRGDSRFAFEYIMDRACELEVVAVVGAGDLIDVKKPPAEVVEFVRRRIDALKKCDCDFLFIQGQHEMSKQPWFTAIHDWPTHLCESQAVYVVEGKNSSKELSIYGIDWQPVDKLQGALARIPKNIDILVCHQVWEEFMGANRGCEGSFSQIPHVSTVFTGDFHSTHIRKDLIGASGQKLTVISPGSTNRRAINEPQQKHFYVLYDDMTWKTDILPSRPFFEATIKTDNALDMFLHEEWPAAQERCRIYAHDYKLPEELSLPLCRIMLHGEIEDAHKKITKAIGKEAEIFWKIITEYEEQIEVNRSDYDKAVAGGLTGCLELLVPKDDERYNPILRLLNSTDPEVELHTMKHERGLLCDS